MATYKLIQDIEAEDHIIGNLSLRQFIYGMVAAFLYYISFFLVTKGVAFLLVFFVPPALFFTFFAFPFGKDQSTEVWALAKLRFFIKPRKRIWNQSGMKELVTITVPKKIEHILTDGLSQGEVKSRLSALATTLDSRGWAVKNVSVNSFSYVDPFAPQVSDRLLSMSTMPREVPSEVYASDDILDESNSPVAQQFASMITESEKAHRQQIIDKMNGLVQKETAQAKPENYWFMNQPPSSALAPNETMFSSNATVQPGAENTQTMAVTDEEKALMEQAKAKSQKQQTSNSHLRTLQPLGSAPVAPPVVQQAPAAQSPTPTTPQADPAIINALAGNNDLDIATLARQASKDTRSNDEVVVSLR